MNKQAGLEARYHVTKIRDEFGEHADCRFFVLDPEHDPLARAALARYASEARAAGFVALANDLDTWLDDIDLREQS